jgi:hypothetical protein
MYFFRNVVLCGFMTFYSPNVATFSTAISAPNTKGDTEGYSVAFLSPRYLADEGEECHIFSFRGAFRRCLNRHSNS